MVNLESRGPLAAPVVVLSLVSALALAGCQPSRSSAGDEEPAAAQPSGEPWHVVNAEPDTADGIRVLVLHDMEGLSGQDDWRTFSFSHPEYARGQEMLIADVNAVIDGLFAGGATEVDVVDGHGSGNPEPDVRADLLDERATQVLRDEPFDTYFDLVEPGAYDAVAVVGMHAKTGSGGFASHTFTLGIEFQINGRSITETELVALSWGRADVPVIFGSGDDRLAHDLQTMPWIEFVTVKTATSASTVELRPVDEARADLREGARRAVENLASAQVMKVNTPIAVTLHAVAPASLEVMKGFPGIDYSDSSVTFVTDDMADAYNGLVAIVGVARTSYSGVLMEQLVGLPNRDEILAAFRVALFERWLDVESGRWAAPERPAADTTGRRYHGRRSSSPNQSRTRTNPGKGGEAGAVDFPEACRHRGSFQMRTPPSSKNGGTMRLSSRALIALMAVLAVACQAPPATSSDPTPDDEAAQSEEAAMNELRDFAERYTDAWSSQDPNAVADFYTEHGSLTINGGEPAVGRDALTAGFHGYMTTFPDLVVIMDELDLSGEFPIYRWTLEGTNTGPDGTGNKVRISGHETWRLGENGRIEESIGTYDAEEYARQIEHGVDAEQETPSL